MIMMMLWSLVLAVVLLFSCYTIVVPFSIVGFDSVVVVVSCRFFGGKHFNFVGFAAF